MVSKDLDQHLMEKNTSSTLSETGLEQAAASEITSNQSEKEKSEALIKEKQNEGSECQEANLGESTATQVADQSMSEHKAISESAIG